MTQTFPSRNQHVAHVSVSASTSALWHRLLHWLWSHHNTGLPPWDVCLSQWRDRARVNWTGS